VKKDFKYKELQIAATATLDSTYLKLTNMRVPPNLQSYRHSKASIHFTDPELPPNHPKRSLQTIS
jgi:hypothetical protein